MFDLPRKHRCEKEAGDNQSAKQCGDEFAVHQFATPLPCRATIV